MLSFIDERRRIRRDTLEKNNNKKVRIARARARESAVGITR